MKHSVFFFFLLIMCSSGQRGTAQLIHTFAGNGVIGYTDSGGVASLAEFNHPWGLVIDGAGNLYIADHVNSAIRKVSAEGVISTFAGTTSCSYGGDGGPASAANMRRPAGMAVDAAGNLYFADEMDHRVRMISPAGIISTITGTGTPGYLGDGGTATAAQVNTPCGVAVDGAGNIYIADSGNNAIRRIDAAGNISTFAGTGIAGYSGDNGPASAAQLNGPVGVSVDVSGNLYIADRMNNAVRKVTVTGTISTFAGNGTAGWSGDNGPATAAQLMQPNSIAFDGLGNIFITDELNNRLRMVSSAGTITTAAGNGNPGYSGDGGMATDAALFRPMGLAVNADGNVFIADFINSVVRFVRLQKVYTPVPGKNVTVQLSPNPASSMLSITAAEIDQIEILNVLGQQVCSANTKDREIRVDVSAYPPGCYSVLCRQEGVIVSVEKFIKN